MKRIVLIVLVLLGVIVFAGTDVALANDANNWGHLKIDVRLEGKALNTSMAIVKDDLYKPGASDSIDSWDTEQTLFRSNRSGAFSDVENKKLTQDVRANASRTAAHIKGYYKGIISPGQEPDITVELSWNYAEPIEGRFGDMPLILTKETADANNIEVGGYRGDLRAEMAYSGPDFASIPFGTLPAGTYTPDTPFLHLRVDFDKPLADFNQTNTVDYKDFAILSKNWRKAGRRMTDISGTDGIPDNIVDMYDLKAVIKDWQK